MDRDLSPEEGRDDSALEPTLRPKSFAHYVGQADVKRKLKVVVEAAKRRGKALDHVLLSGPPGLGKTTLAAIIANELGVQLHTTSGPAIDKKGDLAGLLSSLQEGDILFIDEIHRLSSVIEENLYPAMEDFAFDILLGEGAHARSLRLSLPPFTLVGATTRTGLLTGPLRDRFGIIERLDYYTPDDLTAILLQSSAALGITLIPDAASSIARRSRGTPRIANRLLRRVRDYMEVAGASAVDHALAQYALNELGIDEGGLDWFDRKYLEVLIAHFEGGPVGIDTLASALGEAAHSIEDVHEPYLLQQGFLQRTPRGRVATLRAWALLGRTPGSHAQQQLALSLTANEDP